MNNTLDTFFGPTKPYREPADKPKKVELEWWEESPPTDEEKEFWKEAHKSYCINPQAWTVKTATAFADNAVICFRRRFKKE